MQFANEIGYINNLPILSCRRATLVHKIMFVNCTSRTNLHDSKRTAKNTMQEHVLLVSWR